MAQQNKNQPKAKPGWRVVWNWLQVIKDLCFYQVFWLRWLQFVLFYLIYQFITSFGKSCLFTRICRS